MMFAVTCPHCRQSNQVDESRLGNEMRCAHCRKAFVVQAKRATAPPAPRDEGIQAKARPEAAPAPSSEIRRSDPMDDEPVRRRRFDDDDDDDAPRRRRHRRYDERPRSSGNLGLIVGLSIGGVLLLLALVALITFVMVDEPPPPPVVQIAPPFALNPPPIVIQPLPGFNPGNFPDPFAPQGPILDPTRADHFDKMMDELKSDDEGRRHIAYNWLKLANPNHPRRAEVAKMLEERVAKYRAQTFGDDQFFAAYFAWATKDNFPWLDLMAKNEEFTVWGNERRHSAMTTMGRHKDERGAEGIAKNLESIFHRDVAFKALVELGPAAEKAVTPYLTHNDEWVRSKAQELIAGYKKSGGK